MPSNATYATNIPIEIQRTYETTEMFESRAKQTFRNMLCLYR